MFEYKSINQILEYYKAGSATPIDFARECIEKTIKFDETGIWSSFNAEALLQSAEKLTDRLKEKKELTLLDGILIGVKDIFNTLEFPTQMGSPIWKDFTPGNDARTVFYLKEAGAIIAGKTVTAEFAVHTLDKTLNPHDVTRTPGTSSSGSAAAIALGMVPVALGTQTAGSIVRPASFCGVYGCKPSFGLIPRTGILKTTDSLDTVGYFVSMAEDLERIFNVLRVHGPNYPISYEALKDKQRQNKPDNRPWKVAVVKTHTWEYAEEYAREAIMNWAERISVDAEIELSFVDLPVIMDKSHTIHETIYNKTLSYYFQEEYKKRELVSSVMNELIEAGNNITVADYHAALKEQEVLIHVMDDFLQNYDIMISLSTAGEAPLRNVVEKPDSALMWTLAHLPVVSAPVFTSPSGMPFGLQISSRKYNDLLLFNFIKFILNKELIPKGANSLSNR